MRDWLAAAANEHRERPALIPLSGVEQSWGELAQAAAALSVQLSAAGLGPGQRAIWIGASGAQGVRLLFALARLDAVFVPLNIRLTADELRAQARIAAGTLILCDETCAAQAEALGDEWPVCCLDNLPATSPRGLPAVHQLNPAAMQSIVFTSGTTGTPKGAQITWLNQYTSATASAQRLGASETDRWLLTLPLYHVGGMAIPFRAALSGAAVVEFDLSKGFDAARLMAALTEHAITHVSLVPTMLHRLLEAGFAGTPHLRCILLGGAAASPELLERAFAAGLPVAPTYGLTEACSQVATLPPEAAPRKPGSVGKPLSGTTVTIVHDDGVSAAPGEIGEIIVRGPTVFAGYLNAPDDRALQNGVLHTGDLGYLDAEGDLFVVQRRTDLIVTGGENVYPAEVEAVLLQHPAVAQACVVGLPDAEWGQRVAAAVILRAETDAAALEQWCRARLAGYKCPRQIRIVSNLPLTASGKVIRRAVADLMATT